MQSLSEKIQWRNFLSVVLALAVLSSPALGWQQSATTTATTAAAKPSTPLSKTERDTVSQLKLETIREAVTTLSSKEMEGRGTAQPGADRAARYIAERYAKFGLKPLGDAGTYMQAIKFKVAQVLPESSVKLGDNTVLKFAEDFVVPPPYTSEQADASGGVAFIGYGVVSEELKRDDLAGLDLKGKIVVMLNGRPKGVDEAAWAKASNPQTRLMNILSRGATAFILANVGNAKQPFSVISNYLSRRRVSLATAPEPPFKLPPILLASDAAVEKLFAGSGATYAQTLEKATAGENVSRDLAKTATLTLRVKKEEGTSSNVVGVLEGSDPKLKDQAVVYTAHYDAYGVDVFGRIYPGAADNALGTGMIIGIAEAFSKATPKPRRSIIFLAVTGEEYGLLGAEHWVRNPTWPIEKVVADINHDSAGSEIYAPVKRIVAWGQEHSDLGAVFEGAVAATGNIVEPDPVPEEGVFQRSDHYAFVKRGVPALMMMGAPATESSVWLPRLKKWMETDYHSPEDKVMPDWNWSGPHTLATVGLVIGMRVANAEQMPAWLASSPFNRPRGTSAPPKN
ncbi:MAG TPA: M28 family peptidase [Pyrinomonadaceae bacterium]|jgi:hypothetical protein